LDAPIFRCDVGSPLLFFSLTRFPFASMKSSGLPFLVMAPVNSPTRENPPFQRFVVAVMESAFVCSLSGLCGTPFSQFVLRRGVAGVCCKLSRQSAVCFGQWSPLLFRFPCLSFQRYARVAFGVLPAFSPVLTAGFFRSGLHFPLRRQLSRATPRLVFFGFLRLFCPGRRTN